MNNLFLRGHEGFFMSKLFYLPVAVHGYHKTRHASVFRMYGRHLYSTNISSPKERDYYAILGVRQQASARQIKHAFYQLSLKHHPDRANGDRTKFLEISEAYSVLSNERKRKNYDNTLTQMRAQEHPLRSRYHHNAHRTHVHRSRRTNSQPLRDDPHYHHYRDKANAYGYHEFRRNAESMNAKTYDYDAHFDAHYGSEIREQARRNAQKRREEAEKNRGAHDEEARSRAFIAVYWPVLGIGFWILYRDGSWFGNNNAVRGGAVTSSTSVAAVESSKNTS